MTRLPLAAALALAIASPAAAQVAGVPLDMEPRQCDRACLETYVERYLAAMAHGGFDESLFARDVRFTENGVELPLGNEGLWATTVSPEGYRLVVPDVVTGQVAALVTVREQASQSATGPQRDGRPIGLCCRCDPVIRRGGKHGVRAGRCKRHRTPPSRRRRPQTGPSAPPHGAPCRCRPRS